MPVSWKKTTSGSVDRSRLRCQKKLSDLISSQEKSTKEKILQKTIWFPDSSSSTQLKKEKEEGATPKKKGDNMEKKNRQIKSQIALGG